MNKFLKKKVKKDLEVELLERKTEVEYRVLSNEFKYHIKLRKSFCLGMTLGLSVNYFFLWDLVGSQESLGEILVIFVGEIMLPCIYYFYTSINQWIIEKLNGSKEG